MNKDNEIFRDKIIRGLELTYKRLIEYKTERNLDLVISKNGKVMKINAKKYRKQKTSN